jgi:hypothetical protein
VDFHLGNYQRGRGRGDNRFGSKSKMPAMESAMPWLRRKMSNYNPRLLAEEPTPRSALS